MPEDDSSGQPEGGESPVIRELREKAARADELAKQNAQMQRELAITKSGIDVDHPLGQFFMRNYDGDPADVDGLKEQAKALGVPFKGDAQAAPEGQPQPEGAPLGTPEPAEPTGTAERMALARGAAPDEPSNPTPRQQGLKLSQDALAQGASWEEAAGGFIAHIAQAAHRGDPRVIVPSKRIVDIPRG